MSTWMVVVWRCVGSAHSPQGTIGTNLVAAIQGSELSEEAANEEGAEAMVLPTVDDFADSTYEDQWALWARVKRCLAANPIRPQRDLDALLSLAVGADWGKATIAATAIDTTDLGAAALLLQAGATLATLGPEALFFAAGVGVELTGLLLLLPGGAAHVNGTGQWGIWGWPAVALHWHWPCRLQGHGGNRHAAQPP